MNYNINIKGKEYKLTQGFTISEQFNETLDSGSAIISNCLYIEDLEPYDDVFIYSDICENGQPFVFKGYPVNAANYGQNGLPKFYKHFLVDQYQEEMLFFGDKEQPSRFQYTIQLFSETKRLETIQLPNISITQSLNPDKKISIYDYINQFVNMYNIEKRVLYTPSGSTIATNQWTFENKYKVSSTLYNIFKDTYSPDFTMNCPSLRDLLSKLFIVKDCIPYVKDDVIYALNVSERVGQFNASKGEINYITGSKSSDGYCTNLKRNYTDALSQNNSGRLVEYLGFRNGNTALMTFDDLRLETRFPIYKVNKLYMCYYQKIKVDGEVYYFLCKQDMSKLVKLNSERNLLSQDWSELNRVNKKPFDEPTTIEELSRYKMATVGYDIGSNYIEGWGTKYSYPKSFWWPSKECSYIENIINFLCHNYPYGIYSSVYVLKDLLGLDLNEIKDAPTLYKEWEDGIVIGDTNGVLKKYNATVILKSLFFEMEYQPFYNGAIICSKNMGRDDIVVNDNQSSSLAILEQDGINQKEKIDRMSNKDLLITSRYQNVNDVQPLGSVFENDSYSDIVIYNREISINDNVVNVTYRGSKDYVLKNYFTSVFARYRTYKLMSLGESINRAENEHTYILLSKKYNYVDEVKFYDGFKSDLLSFFRNNVNENTPYDDLLKFTFSKNINKGYFKWNNNYYASDINSFVSANSLNFNMTTYDNVSMGVYIKQIISDADLADLWDLNSNLKPSINDEENFTGSKMDYYMCVDDDEIGRTTNLSFVLMHDSGENQIINGISNANRYIRDPDNIVVVLGDKINDSYDKIYALPLIDVSLDSDSKILQWDKNLNLDNKEKLDITFQFELINDETNYEDSDIFFNDNVLKLSDLSTTSIKTKKDLLIPYYDLATLQSKLSIEYLPKEPTYEEPNEFKTIIDKFKFELAIPKTFNFDKNKGFIYNVFNEYIDAFSDGGGIRKSSIKNKFYVYDITYSEDGSTFDVNMSFDINVVVGMGQPGGVKAFEFKKDKTKYTFIRDREDVDFVYYVCTWNIAYNVLAKLLYEISLPYVSLASGGRNRNVLFDNVVGDVDSSSIKEDEDGKYKYNINEYKVYQTLFYVLSPNSVKKSDIYNEYTTLPSDMVSCNEYMNIDFVNNHINIDFSQDISSYNSLQCYYKNGNKYEFVFGTNFNESEIKNRNVKIYASLLRKKDMTVYDNKNVVVGKNVNLLNVREGYIPFMNFHIDHVGYTSNEKAYIEIVNLSDVPVKIRIVNVAYYDGEYEESNSFDRYLTIEANDYGNPEIVHLGWNCVNYVKIYYMDYNEFTIYNEVWDERID